jgi:putative transposase
MVVAREQLVRQGEPGVYHCVSRVVRRAYLMGEDPLTQKNFRSS